tara:strand:- start:624 stop:827 length:204 start_codon:yes stop_codon:yes gene_type:complete
MATQCELLLKDLKKGKKINPLYALKRYGCFRLGARIHDLKSQGHDIEMKMVDSGTKKFGEYSLRMKK